MAAARIGRFAAAGEKPSPGLLVAG